MQISSSSWEPDDIHNAIDPAAYHLPNILWLRNGTQMEDFKNYCLKTAERQCASSIF